ncbi:MAG: Membrane protein [Planctomycetaceae bacterium]|nr:Membrane protein [Planctomycetaceae bacterium]
MAEPEVIPPTPAAVPQSVISVEALEAENLIDIYQVIAEWIRFADAKAAVVLTVGGGLAGLLIPTLKEYLHSDKLVHPFPWWTKVVVVIYSLWVISLVLSSIWAFRCILPFRRNGKHPALGRCAHFHPAAILAAYKLDDVDQFIEDCSKLGTACL